MTCLWAQFPSSENNLSQAGREVCLVQCGLQRCATLDSAEEPPKRCSTVSLPNNAQPVLISIRMLHGPDHSELLSVNKISVSQLSVREGDPCSDPGHQSSSLYKPLLLFVLCIFPVKSLKCQGIPNGNLRLSG